jgi:hypothetical protein
VLHHVPSQNLSFACSDDINEKSENSVHEILYIPIKYTYPSIQNILFCELEGVIRFSLPH